MALDLSDDEKLAPHPSPDRTIEDDRYLLSPRIRTRQDRPAAGLPPRENRRVY
jgi:hypothetical protein